MKKQETQIDVNESHFNKLVTSTDVAKLAGVSQTSVSRVFNPESSRTVKEETREKVLKAAKELGYRPNFIARSMISKRTGIIGVVVGSPVGPFYNKIITSLIVKLQNEGKQCLLFTFESGQNIEIILQRVLQYQVDGIIITAAALSHDMANICIENETPIILFNRFVPGLNASAVYCDNIEAGRMVARLFAEAGYKNIAHVTYDKDSASALERKIGFYGMLREFGIYKVQELSSDYTYDSGYETGMKLFNKGNPPEAIFCTSDLIALGIMDAARIEFGLKVPEDISVVGFDDIEMASWKSYDLTTVRQPVDELIEDTINLLDLLIETRSFEPVFKVVKTKLIQRRSTKNK